MDYVMPTSVRIICEIDFLNFKLQTKVMSDLFQTNFRGLQSFGLTECNV